MNPNILKFPSQLQLALLLISFISITNAVALPPILELQPNQSSSNQLTPYFLHWKENQSIEASQLVMQLEQFSAIESEEINFGFSESPHWLVARVVNRGDSLQDWVLFTSARSRKSFTVYQFDGKSTSQLAAYNDQQSFGERAFNYHLLATNIRLQPNVENLILIRFESEFTTRLRLQFMTQADFAKRIQRESFIFGIFLATMICLAIVNLAQFIAVRQPVYFYYTLMTLLNCLYVTQHEGYNFQYLWPLSPSFDAFATTALSVIVAAANIQVFRTAVNLKSIAPTLNRMVIGFQLIMLFSIVPLISFASNLLSMFIAAAIPFSILIVATVIITAARAKKTSTCFYAAAWLSFTLANGLFLGLSVGGTSLPSINLTHLLQIGITLEALFLSMALAHQVRVLRQEFQKTQEDHIQLLNNYMRDLEHLHKLQIEKDHAQKSFRERTIDFANSRHDLYQPLYALRLGLDTISSKIDAPEQLNNMESAIQIAEQILQTSIEEAKHDWKINADKPLINLQEIIALIVQQNQPIAEQKHLEVKSSVKQSHIQADKTVIIRILDNLVGNAIRYSSKGAISIKTVQGEYQANHGTFIEVQDNGPGISPEEIELLLAPFQRGEEINFNQGQFDDSNREKFSFGLGLSIVKRFCDQYGFTLLIDSEPGKGSSFKIFIPAAVQQPSANQNIDSVPEPDSQVQ